MRKQDEKGKMGQELLEQGGFLSISQADSPPASSHRVQNRFHGLQCPGPEKETETKKCWGPKTSGAWGQVAPRFSLGIFRTVNHYTGL